MIIAVVPVEIEKFFIRISFAKYRVPDNFCRNYAECNTIAAETKGKISVWPLRNAANIRQTILSFCKGAGPAKISLYRDMRHFFGERADQPGRLAFNYRRIDMRAMVWVIAAADKDAVVTRHSEIHIRCSRFPNEAVFIPEKFIRQGFRHQSIG